MSILRHPLLWILFFSLLFLTYGITNLALSDNDAMFPQIAREMRQTGDWITPRLNDALHFDKPPLVYWMIGLSQSIFGETEATARIWPVLANWFTILIVGGIGASLNGRRAGWLSALVLAGCLGPFLFSRVVSTDAMLCLWTALAILSYIRAVIDKGRYSGLWLMVMFVSFGLAGLTKALLGIGLPTTIVGLHAILSGRWKSFLSWRTALGILLMAAVVAPWHILVARANPDFLWYYFIREHVLRFTGQRFPRDEFLSAPVFLVFTILWTFPWMGVLPQALSGTLRRIKQADWRTSKDLLPCLWFLLIIGLFTASRSRMEYYSLPAIPAFALLIGKLWDEALQGESRSSRRFMAISLGLMSVILLIAAVAAWEVLGPSKEEVFQFFGAWWPQSGWSGTSAQIATLERIRIPTAVVLAGSALFVLGASLASLLSRPGLACGLLAAIMAPIFIMANWGFVLMEPFMSSRPVVDILKRANSVEAVVIQQPHEYQSIGGMVFYSGRPVYIFEDSKSENPFMKYRDLGARFLSHEDLRELWGSEKRVALVFERSKESETSRLLQSEPANVIGKFGTRVVVTNILTRVSAKETASGKP